MSVFFSINDNEIENFR